MKKVTVLRTDVNIKVLDFFTDKLCGCDYDYIDSKTGKLKNPNDIPNIKYYLLGEKDKKGFYDNLERVENLNNQGSKLVIFSTTLTELLEGSADVEYYKAENDYRTKSLTYYINEEIDIKFRNKR